MKFMCKLSKNTYEFTSAFDIEQMKKHPDYEVVADESPPQRNSRPLKTPLKELSRSSPRSLAKGLLWTTKPCSTSASPSSSLVLAGLQERCTEQWTTFALTCIASVSKWPELYVQE
jgi:hypothetical protein